LAPQHDRHADGGAEQQGELDQSQAAGRIEDGQNHQANLNDQMTK
jgi:hypothetical protein